MFDGVGGELTKSSVHWRVMFNTPQRSCSGAFKFTRRQKIMQTLGRT